MFKNPNRVGSGWKKTGVDRNGQQWSFISLAVELNGQQHPLTLNLNKYKKQGDDKSPDFTVTLDRKHPQYSAKPQGDRQQFAHDERAPNPARPLVQHHPEDDIPF